MIKKNANWLFVIVLNLLLFSAHGQEYFNNPLLSKGADPYSFYHNGYYYYTHTLGNHIKIWKVKNLAQLPDAESKTIFSPPANKSYSKQLWAPEIHFLKGKWYVYFAASDGDNLNHRMYVLENKNENPFLGEWELKGKIAAKPDRWAIDGNVFEYKGKLFMIWSGWEGLVNGQQNIYIAPMDAPWSIEGDRVLIAEPTYIWEKQGDLQNPKNPHVNVNEGPQFLEKNSKIFIVYSANGCWTDFYSLGLLYFKGKDILDPASWKKQSNPIFKKSEENSVYAPGHNSFFKSTDGKEDWILYHANDNPGDGCGSKRSPRMQKIDWDKNGFPVLGIPVANSEKMKIPSK